MQNEMPSYSGNSFFNESMKFSNIQETNPFFSPQFPYNLLNFNENCINCRDCVINQYQNNFNLNEPSSSQRAINFSNINQEKVRPNLSIDIENIQNESNNDSILNFSGRTQRQNFMDIYTAKNISPLYYSPNLFLNDLSLKGTPME